MCETITIDHRILPVVIPYSLPHACSESLTNGQLLFLAPIATAVTDMRSVAASGLLQIR